jgi:hypothetical protein
MSEPVTENEEPRQVDLLEGGAVVVLENEAPAGHFPRCFGLGYWYAEQGLFYADLKSAEQWQYNSPVNKRTIGSKRLGGTRTKEELREYVMQYVMQYCPSYFRFPEMKIPVTSPLIDFAGMREEERGEALAQRERELRELTEEKIAKLNEIIEQLRH